MENYSDDPGLLVAILSQTPWKHKCIFRDPSTFLEQQRTFLGLQCLRTSNPTLTVTVREVWMQFTSVCLCLKTGPVLCLAYFILPTLPLWQAVSMAWPLERGSMWSQRKQHVCPQKPHRLFSLTKTSQPQIDQNTWLPNTSQTFGELLVVSFFLYDPEDFRSWKASNLLHDSSIPPSVLPFSESQWQRCLRLLLVHINFNTQVFPHVLCSAT